MEISGQILPMLVEMKCSPGLKIIGLLVLLNLSGFQILASSPDKIILEELKIRYAEYVDTRYFLKWFDLNEDGRQEAIVYVVGSSVCGTGGCQTLIFQLEGNGMKLMQSIGLTKTPIMVSVSPTKNWKNLIVWRGGGGGPSGLVELMHDGKSYPSNTNSGRPLRHQKNDINEFGIILIKDFDSYLEATPVFK